MSSSRIDPAQQRLPIFPAAPASAAALADSHRRWWKRALPRSLWGRSLLIIVLPMVLLELMATWFFYDRVWDTVVRRLSSAVAGDIGFTLNSLSTADDRAERDLLLAKSGDVTELVYAFRQGETLPAGLQRAATLRPHAAIGWTTCSGPLSIRHRLPPTRMKPDAFC